MELILKIKPIDKLLFFTQNDFQSSRRILVREKIKPTLRSVNSTLTKLFVEFFDSEQSSGIILILCTLIAIGIANSPIGKEFVGFWHIELGFEAGAVALNQSLEHWVNDGLMAIFFLLIGLEVEREIYLGELSNLKNASLPILAAIGGMMIPAFLHFLLNRGTETQNGIGIPMATDIAFALGVLALLGKKIPSSLKVFLAALAIIDDLGAIVVIALFYVGDFSLFYLILALSVFAGLLILNRLGVHALPVYLIPGTLMWYFMLQSGVHATLAGVLLAFALPFGDGSVRSPSYKLQHFLHKPVAFGIMPVFALANTGIMFSDRWLDSLTTMNSLGVFCGLLIGKPLGILSASFIAVKTGLSELSEDLSWKHIVGAGFLGGIGFTMSIFITLLAFNDPEIIQSTKIIILLSSLLAGLTGFLILSRWTSNNSS
ncbi:MAG TPA: Na+/H+ antiporter NhaA [Anaerolineales bacterium]|nr:Na+/H+ antiporter NhaA [Anaerolineales bacterium]